MSATWPIPIEAVRHGVTIDGSVVLAKLAEAQAEFQPTCIAELFEGGWVATLIYSQPGHPGRFHHAHVRLSWAPRENMNRPNAQLRLGDGPQSESIHEN